MSDLGEPKPDDVQTSRARRIHWPEFPIVLYPIATPVATILYLGASVASHPIWLIRPLVIVIVLGLLISVAVRLLVRDKHRAGIASWAVIVGLTVDDPRASVLVWGVAGLLIATWVVAGRQPWRLGPRVTTAMVVFAVVLLVASVARAIQVGGLQAGIDEIGFDLSNQPPSVAGRPMPDIYLVLLDAYPGGSVAQTAPNFDERFLPDRLAATGFDVSANSRANYLVTRLTLPSIFDARHLSTIEGLAPGTRVEDSRALRVATDAGSILGLLGSLGYERIAVNSGYSELGPMRVDRLVIPPQLNEMEAAIFQATGAGGVIDVVAPEFLAHEVRARILDTFNAAAELAEEPHVGPRFAFIHVPAPHAPWVTDANGNLVVRKAQIIGLDQAPDGDVAERERQFYDFSTWVAGLTVTTIDRILGASAAPPIIVVFSDHGPDFDFDHNDPLSSDLDARTGNLMAVLGPGRADVFPDDVTTVNLFPYVLNHYLGADLPLQANTFWAWPANASTLDLVELDPRTWKAK